MATKKARQNYSKEYKLEALKLIEEVGVSKAASALGMDPSLLSRWRKAVQIDGAEAFRGNGNRTAVEEENRRLRQELKSAKEEIEILKKASAYFAKHVR